MTKEDVLQEKWNKKWKSRKRVASKSYWKTSGNVKKPMKMEDM